MATHRKSSPKPGQPAEAIVFTNDLLDTIFAKTCHGLLRGSERFHVLAVIDSKFAGKDAGEILDGQPRNVPVFASVEAFLAQATRRPEYLVVGVAFPGGYLPDSCRGEILAAMRHGMSVVCGLHHLLSDDPEFARVAKEQGVQLIDIRKPRPTRELHFWSGEIYSVRAPRIAVLGTDCAVGKRTTCRLLMQACNAAGIKTEMIYTGQTGWMQGYPYGFILDATPNDFVSGELERVIVQCDREAQPDLILIEGQSSLRNPSGPCGSELLLSADAKGVVLQHAPMRAFFTDLEELGCRLPAVPDEIRLIQMYGAKVLAVTLSDEGDDEEALRAYQRSLQREVPVPVIRPLREGVEALVPVVREFLAS